MTGETRGVTGKEGFVAVTRRSGPVGWKSGPKLAGTLFPDVRLLAFPACVAPSGWALVWRGGWFALSFALYHFPGERGGGAWGCAVCQRDD